MSKKIIIGIFCGVFFITSICIVLIISTRTPPIENIDGNDNLYISSSNDTEKTTIVDKSDNDILDNSFIKKENEISVWDGSIEYDFESGDGSVHNPYIIKNAAQLVYFAECVNNGNSFSGKNIKLINNINLNGMSWTPIGTWHSKYAFSGSFDGNNCFISNYVITRPDYNDAIYHAVGFFGYINNATIKNLVVKNFNIRYTCSELEVGGLVGVAISSYILNCHVINGSMNTYSGTLAIGGLAGCTLSENNIKSYIYNCSSNVYISSDLNITYNPTHIGEDGNSYYDSILSYYAGGFIGNTNNCDINNCFSTGEMFVSAEDTSYLGAYAGGFISRAEKCIVSNCYSDFLIDISGAMWGGYFSALIGYSYGSIKNCYSAGSVKCNGGGTYTAFISLGGIAGNNSGSIENCFTFASLTATDNNVRCDYICGNHDEENRPRNSYAADSCDIELEEYSTQKDTVINTEKLLSIDFLTKNMLFSEYSGEEGDSKNVFSGWQITSANLPQLFFYKQIVTSQDLKCDDLLKYLGLSAKDIIKELGNDYYFDSYNTTILCFSKYQIAFQFNEPLSITNLDLPVTTIINGSDHIFENKLITRASFPDICSVLNKKLDKPKYIEMDDIYFISITIDDKKYDYIWYTSDYNFSKCDSVYISKS